MWTYNYTNELYHYGVKGMKWGVRRAQKRLARLTNRHKSQVSESEAENFIADVKDSRRNKSVRYKINKNGTTTYLNRNNEKVSAEYGRALVKEYNTRRAAKVIGTTAAVIGGIKLAQCASLGTLAKVSLDSLDDLLD